MVELGIGLILLVLIGFALGYCSNSSRDDELARQRRQADEITLSTLETVQALRAQGWQARHDMRRAVGAEVIELEDDAA